jgi:hypothetical protein
MAPNPGLEGIAGAEPPLALSPTETDLLRNQARLFQLEISKLIWKPVCGGRGLELVGFLR